jgi:hypothetical protein
MTYGKVSEYLEKLLNHLRFEEFQDIIGSKSFIKSCPVFKNKEVIDCSNSYRGIMKVKN